MNFNQLKAVSKRWLVISASVFFFASCNDEKSANNSTPGTAEADTSAKTEAPVVAKKKSGKVSTNISADDATVKMEKDKMGYYLPGRDYSFH